MKPRNTIIYLLIALIILSLFGCAEQPGVTGESAMPGDSEQSETTPETTDGELSVQTGVRSSADIDISEMVIYERRGMRAELSDLALKALSERFEGCSSVSVDGIRIVTKVEGNNEVPDYYSYDVEADGNKYTLDITFDNEITIYPYIYENLVADSEEGLLPVILSEELQGNISGKYKYASFPVELDLGGHNWTVNEHGPMLCDRVSIFDGWASTPQNFCLTDFNRDGVKDILIVAGMSSSMPFYFAFAAVDTKNCSVIWDNLYYSVYALSARKRTEYGDPVTGRMKLAVNKEGELLLLDEPLISKAGTYEYKVCYDPRVEKIRFVFIQKFDEEVRPDDVRVTG